MADLNSRVASTRVMESSRSCSSARVRRVFTSSVVSEKPLSLSSYSLMRASASSARSRAAFASVRISFHFAPAFSSRPAGVSSPESPAAGFAVREVALGMTGAFAFAAAAGSGVVSVLVAEAAGSGFAAAAAGAELSGVVSAEVLTPAPENAVSSASPKSEGVSPAGGVAVGALVAIVGQ